MGVLSFRYRVIGDRLPELEDALDALGGARTVAAPAELDLITGTVASIAVRLRARSPIDGVAIACITDGRTAGAEALLDAGAEDVLVWPADRERLTVRARIWQRSVARRGPSAFLSSVLDAVPDPVFVKNEDHRWIAFNRGFCELMGRRPDELLGRSDYDFVPRDEADVFWAKDQLVLDTGETNENEEHLSAPDGSRRVIVTKKARIVDAHGKRILVGVIRDITERKRMQTQLAISERMASVGTLAAGIAHDLNSPLAYVMGNLEYLRTALTDSAVGVSDAVHEALQGTVRMRDLVQDLKRFSRIDVETPSAVDLGDVVQLSTRTVANQLRMKARVVTDVHDVPAVRVHASRLAQVLINLLVNAADAFATYADTNEIHIEARGLDARVELVVRDNGRGMPPDVLARVFDPFFTTKAVGSGTGLGLSICHRIIESFGGDIAIASELGRGTVVTISIPRWEGTCVEAIPAAKPVAPPRRQVVIIDDEPLLTRSFKRTLSQFHDVTTFDSAESALTAFRGGLHADAILCDLMMPGIGGRGFYEQIVHVEPRLVSRIAFLTGGVFDDDVQTFLDRLDNPRLQKPPTRAELLATIDKLAGA